MHLSWRVLFEHAIFTFKKTTCTNHVINVVPACIRILIVLSDTISSSETNNDEQRSRAQRDCALLVRVTVPEPYADVGPV